MRDESFPFNREIFENIFSKKGQLENKIKGVQNTLERVDLVRLVLLDQQL